MAKRILHIIPTLDLGGAEKQLCLLVSGLPPEEFEVHVCALTRGGPRQAELIAAGVPTHVVGKRWKADPLGFAALYRYIAKLKPQLVHTWLFAGGTYGRMAAKMAGVPLLVAGERCVDKWKAGWQWAIDRKLAKWTDSLVTNSTAVRDYNAEHGVPAEKFTVIPNGIHEARPSDVTREQLLEELDLPADARLIGAVGRHWPQKRTTDLIWAADLIRVLHDNVRLLVIGDGPQRPQLERFARLASDLDHIRFLGERDDVWRIMPHLDVLWQASAYEGQSNTVMEAMACGVPVVASDIPGHRDFVVHGETGYLVPIAARAARVRWTDRIFQDDELAKRLGDAGEKRIREEFSVEQMVQRYVELYRLVLGSQLRRNT